MVGPTVIILTEFQGRLEADSMRKAYMEVSLKGSARTILGITSVCSLFLVIAVASVPRVSVAAPDTFKVKFKSQINGNEMKNRYRRTEANPAKFIFALLARHMTKNKSDLY